MTMVYREVNADCNNDAPAVATVRIVGTDSIALFKEMVRRANNCWDTAPADMKEFCDIVTEGRPLQQYHKMSNFSKKQEPGQ